MKLGQWTALALAGFFCIGANECGPSENFGRIQITTEPTNASITWNGEFMGESPIEFLVPVGSYTVGASKEGYQTDTRTIDVQTGGPVEILIVLQPDEVPTDPEVEAKIQEFKQIMDTTLNSILPNETKTTRNRLIEISQSGGYDADAYYFLSQSIGGLVSMYEATKEIEYIDLALKLCLNMVDAAHPIQGDEYDSVDLEKFGSDHREWQVSSTDPRSVLLYDIQAAAGMTRVTRVIHENEDLRALYDLQKYKVVFFVRDHIMTKWLITRSEAQNWLEFPYLPESFVWRARGGYFADKLPILGRVANDLYESGSTEDVNWPDFSLSQYIPEDVLLDDFRKWNDYAEQIATILLVSVFDKENDGSYIWSQDSIGTLEGLPDVSHEARVASFMIQLEYSGLLIDSIDINGLVKTFENRVWNGKLNLPSYNEPWHPDQHLWFHNYIASDVNWERRDRGYRELSWGDGSICPQTGFSGNVCGTNGLIYDGWIRLGEYSYTSQQVGEAAMSGFLDDDYAWDTNLMYIFHRRLEARVAMPGHLARNLRYKRY